MMLAVLFSVAGAAGAPAVDDASAPVWQSARVWPEDASQAPAIIELYPNADPALGPHSALHRTNLDGCWRQHGALGEDLDLTFCLDLKVRKKGTVEAKVTELSDPRPGLDVCIDTLVETWTGPVNAPTKATMCRRVYTNVSGVAKELWATDPWAVAEPAGRTRTEAVSHTHEVGRAKAEDATRIERDPTTGNLNRVPAPLQLRDRATTTARRLVTGQVAVLEACWRDHGAWRPPPSPGGDEPLLAYTLEVTVGPAGVETVTAGRTAPPTHASVAQCAAAMLDGGVPPDDGSQVVEIPVLIRP